MGDIEDQAGRGVLLIEQVAGVEKNAEPPAGRPVTYLQTQQQKIVAVEPVGIVRGDRFGHPLYVRGDQPSAEGLDGETGIDRVRMRAGQLVVAEERVPIEAKVLVGVRQPAPDTPSELQP